MSPWSGNSNTQRGQEPQPRAGGAENSPVRTSQRAAGLHLSKTLWGPRGEFPGGPPCPLQPLGDPKCTHLNRSKRYNITATTCTDSPTSSQSVLWKGCMNESKVLRGISWHTGERRTVLTPIMTTPGLTRTPALLQAPALLHRNGQGGQDKTQ